MDETDLLMEQVHNDRASNLIEIKDAPLEREIHARISYPFSDTEDSEAEGPSPTRPGGSSAYSTPSSSYNPPSATQTGMTPPLPVPPPKQQSNHISWKDSSDAIGDDGEDSDGQARQQRSVSFSGGISLVGSQNSVTGWGSLDSEKVLRSGYLRKKGEKRKSWKTRWFVLRTNKLAYYKNDKEYELLNIIPLENVTTVADVDLSTRWNVFGVITRDRTYFLQANSPTEMESWSFIMREALKEFQKHTGGPPPPIRPRTASNEASRRGSAMSPANFTSVSRAESKVQFADTVVTPSSATAATPHTSGGSSSGTAPPEILILNLKRPLSGGIGLASKPLLGAPLDPNDDANSQISAHESVVTVNSSLLTYVSTPSMLPGGNANADMSTSLFPVSSSELVRLHTDGSNESASLSAEATQRATQHSQVHSSPTHAISTIVQSPAQIPPKMITPSASPLTAISVSPTSTSATNLDSQTAKPRFSTLASHVVRANNVPITPPPATPSALRKPRGQSAPDQGGPLPTRPKSDGLALQESILQQQQQQQQQRRQVTDGDLAYAALIAKRTEDAPVFSSSSEDEDGGLLFVGPSKGRIGSSSAAGVGSGGGIGGTRVLGQVVVGVTDNSVVREGYLHKQGTKYNKEYVVKRIVPMRTVLDILEIDSQGRQQQHCFKVVLAKRTLILSAGTEEEMSISDQMGLIAIPYWIGVVSVFSLIPAIHFILLTRTGLGNAAICMTVCAIWIGFTLLFQCGEEAASTIVRVFATVFFVLKSLEISTGPRSGSKVWTVIDYIEFIFTSDNKPLRLLRNCDSSSKEVKARGIVFPADRSLEFYLSFGCKLTITWIVYAFTLAYFRVYPLEAVFGLVAPWDIKGLLNGLLHALNLYSALEFGYLPIFVLVLLLRAPYAPIFNAPYLATSLREFWANRWDLVIQKMIHTIAFKPTLAYLSSKFHGKGWIPVLGLENTGQAIVEDQRTRKYEPAHVAISVMTAFAFSSLLHEYIVSFVCHKSLCNASLDLGCRGVGKEVWKGL
ncbi:UNVERIFIED_CONTAM: hypothetical protein HDU68_002656 [Siphonaria sp. JEL0065]|nr:hypothetical protein HDU68_002656 [Siphonaria sp. JEL0065]